MDLEYLHSKKNLFQQGGKSFICFGVKVINTATSINNFNLLKNTLSTIQYDFKELMNSNGFKNISSKVIIMTDILPTDPNRSIFKNLEFNDVYIFNQLINNFNSLESILVSIDCETLVINDLDPLRFTLFLFSLITMNSNLLIKTINTFNKNKSIKISLSQDIHTESDSSTPKPSLKNWALNIWKTIY